MIVCCGLVILAAAGFGIAGSMGGGKPALIEAENVSPQAESLAEEEDRYTLRLSGIEKMDQGDYAGAIIDFEAAILASSGRVGEFEEDVLKYRAEAEYALADYGAAAHTYDLLIQLEGDGAEYRYRQALSLALAGDAQGSLEAYRQGEDLEEKDSHQSLSLGRSDVVAAVGKACMEAGLAAEAESIYNEAIADGSAGPQVFNQMGMGFMETEQYERALECFNQALSPTDQTAEGQQAQESQEALRQAAFNRGTALEYLSRFDEALEAFQNYVNTYGPDEEAQKEITFLETR